MNARRGALRLRLPEGTAAGAIAAALVPPLVAGALALSGRAIVPGIGSPGVPARARPAPQAQGLSSADAWVTVDTWRATAHAPLGGVLDPVDLDIAADGSVFVLDRGLHRAQRFDDRTATAAFGGGVGLAPGVLDEPLGVAADLERGRLLVADTGHGTVARFDLATGEVTAWPDLGRPESIAVAPDGRAYVYERERNGISGRGADGAQELLFPVQRALSFVAELPRGLAVSPRGTVFFAAENPVANNPNVLYEFDAEGETLRPRTALPWQIFDIAFGDDARMWLLDGTNARLVGDLDRDRATSGPGVAVPGGARALAAGAGGRLALLYGPTSERPAGIVELVADGPESRPVDAWSFPPLDPAWLPEPRRLAISAGAADQPIVVDGTERAVLANVDERRVLEAFARPGLQEALRLPGGDWVVARTRFAATYDPRDDPDVAAPGTRRVRIERYPAPAVESNRPMPRWTWEHVEAIDAFPVTTLVRLVHDPATGHVHALDAGSGAVITLDEAGGPVERRTLPSRPGIPRWVDLVLLPDGALAALHGGARELHRLDDPGAPPIALDIDATPLRIGVDAAGNLHVLGADRTVAVLALDGSRRSIAALPPSRTDDPDAPSDLAVAPIGTVYVADPSDRAIHVLVRGDLGLRPAFLPALAR